MNAIPSELVREEDTEVVHESDECLVEVGAVSETKGNPFGSRGDTGGGYVFFDN